MGWDQLSAIGSVAAALVILVGSLAAIVQLKHLRLSYQMETYLDLMRQLNSPEMIEAREFVESHNFRIPPRFEKRSQMDFNRRILMVGGFYQIVSRLINFGVLDAGLFAPVQMTAPRVWRALRPIVYEMRARSPENPRWMDIEYLVHSQATRRSSSAKRYAPAFRQRVGLDRQLAEWTRQVEAYSAALAINRLIIAPENRCDFPASRR